MTKLGLLKSGNADKLMNDGTGQPVVIPRREIRPEQFIIGNDKQNRNCQWNLDHSWIG